MCSFQRQIDDYLSIELLQHLHVPGLEPACRITVDEPLLPRQAEEFDRGGLEVVLECFGVVGPTGAGYTGAPGALPPLRK